MDRRAQLPHIPLDEVDGADNSHHLMVTMALGKITTPQMIHQPSTTTTNLQLNLLRIMMGYHTVTETDRQGIESLAKVQARSVTFLHPYPQGRHLMAEVVFAPLSGMLQTLGLESLPLVLLPRDRRRKALHRHLHHLQSLERTERRTKCLITDLRVENREQGMRRQNVRQTTGAVSQNNQTRAQPIQLLPVRAAKLVSLSRLRLGHHRLPSLCRT
jgi:hypothetical protein